jgi:hypothetical protein
LTCQQHRARQAKKCGKAASKAEAALEKWMLKTGTQQCPQCKMAISKENLQSQTTQYKECHKMMCRNCNTRFCFKCLRILTDNVSCGCSIDAHGFVDPRTGKRIAHFDDGEKKGKQREQPKSQKGNQLRSKACAMKARIVRNQAILKGRKQATR